MELVESMGQVKGGRGADGVNGETGISGAHGDNGERGESAHVVEGIVRSSCLPIISSYSLWKTNGMI